MLPESLTGAGVITKVVVWAELLAGFRSDSLALTPAKLPWEGVAETKMAPAGRVYETTTPLAAAGPLLATVTELVRPAPTNSEAGALDKLTPRSATGLTVVTVVRFRLQPEATCPASPTESSRIYKDQVPFASA